MKAVLKSVMVAVVLILVSGLGVSYESNSFTSWKLECKVSGGNVTVSQCNCPGNATEFDNKCWEKTPREACEDEGGRFTQQDEEWICEDPEAEIYGEIDTEPEKYSSPDIEKLLESRDFKSMEKVKEKASDAFLELVSFLNSFL